MKSRLQRWANKKLILDCVRPLYDFVRQGDFDLRLKLVRGFGNVKETDVTLPNDKETKSLDGLKRQTTKLLLEALMTYSQGRGKRKVLPYGAKAARSREYFKKVPSSAFATTMAVMYPFIAEDKDTWKEKSKAAIHPITSLWPKPVVKRFIHFGQTVRQERARMFLNYEKAGGRYRTLHHGEEEEEEDEEFDEAEAESCEDSGCSGCDDVF